MQAYDEVRNREIELSEQQRKIEEGEAKMRQHLNLYEAVRTERNLYSKNLVESQDETDEMKRKFKVMNHLVEQLKEELISKDNALIKEHFDYLKVFPVFPNSVKLLATLVLPGIWHIL